MADKTRVVADIVDNIRRMFQAVNEQSKRAEKETGITGPQLWAIKTIAQESPIMVSDLARRMYLHPATVVGILDRLAKQNLVARVRSTIDKRVVRVELTKRGQELLTEAPEVTQGLLVSGLEQLKTRNLETIAASLDQLVAILGAQDIPPKLILSPEVNKPSSTKKKARRSVVSRPKGKD